LLPESTTQYASLGVETMTTRHAIRAIPPHAIVTPEEKRELGVRIADIL
jgi:hypothetical protein